MRTKSQNCGCYIRPDRHRTLISSEFAVVLQMPELVCHILTIRHVDSALVAYQQLTISSRLASTSIRLVM